MQVLVRHRQAPVALALSVLAAGLLQAVPVQPQAAAAEPGTVAVSTASGASVPSDGASAKPALSADGRYAAFITDASLVEEDANGEHDVYRKDLATGDVVAVSTDSDGVPVGGSDAEQVGISDDGQVVVFRTSGYSDRESPAMHLYHRRLDAVEGTGLSQVDVNDTGVQGFGPQFLSVSGDGEKVAFVHYASSTRPALVAGAPASAAYVRDMAAGTLSAVGASAGAQIALSGDGTRLAYMPPFLPGTDVHCRYCIVTRASDGSGPETLVNVNTSANLADPAGLLGPDALSADGGEVAFWSDGTTYGRGPGTEDTNGARDVFVYDEDVTGDGPVRRVSETADGSGAAQGSGGTTNDWPKGAISADGDRVAFTSASSFGLSETAGGSFVKDMTTGGLTLQSLSAGGDPVGPTSGTTMSADGTVVAFSTASGAVVPGDTNGASDVFARGLSPALDGFTLDVAPSAQAAGVTAVPTADIDLGLLPFGVGEIASSPLRSSPLRSSPLRSSPLRSSPLRSSPLRSSPLRSSPLRSSPLRSSPIPATALPPVPLSTVPLLLDGGWSPRLVGTPHQGAALQSVTLQQVIELAAQTSGGTPTYPLLAELTLADVDITSTPLRSSPLQAFLFAGPTLEELAPQASTSVDWCGRGLPLVVAGCDATTWTLLDLARAVSDPSSLGFVQDLPVRTADLQGSPMAGYDVGSIDVGAAGLGDLATTDLPAAMVDAGRCVLLEGCATLGDAVDRNAITTDPEDGALGRLLSSTDPEVVDTLSGLDLGDLVRGVVDPAKVDYSGVDLDSVVAQGPFDEGRQVTYTARVTVRCASTGSVALAVTLPPGFRYVPGTVRAQFPDDVEVSGPDSEGRDDDVVVDSTDRQHRDDTGAPAGSAATDGRRLDFHVDTCDGSTEQLALSFDASPGVTLGTATTDAAVWTAAGSLSVTDAAPVTVGDASEGAGGEDGVIALAPGDLYVSHISSPGDVDTFALPTGLPAGTRVTAVLSHLPADFDLFLDGPVAAPLRSSPLRSSPLRSSPLEDLDVPGAAGGDVLEPETLEDVPLQSSLLSRSTTAGTEDEQVTTVLTKATTSEDPATIAVTHHLGSSSDRPYMLQVTTESPIELHCPTAPSPFAGSGGVPGTLPALSAMSAAQRSAVKTLFLVNGKRLGDAYSKAEADEVLAELGSLSGRPEVGGLVLPVEGSAAVAAAYAAWDADRCDPEAANDVVRAIGTLVDGYTAQLPQLRYITFVGDDDVVPFARVPDGVSLSNQRDYHPEVVFDALDNPISAAYGRGYVLTDDPLLTRSGIDFLGHQLAVPDYAGGRLVETPSEIRGTIEQYVAQPHITKDRTLVTGYDFLSDLALVLDSALGGTSREVLNDETWTRTQLAEQLGDPAAKDGPTVAAINAHYDHSNSLPADGNASGSPTPDLFTSQDLTASGLPAGALLFTLGCQGGLSVPGRAWAAATPEQATRLLDFAQAMTQAKGNGLLGNTGFGYGDTVAVAYSERLLELFTHNLDGTMTVGQAVVAAKRQYLEEGLVSAYDEKSLAEATFYGLPFVAVGPSGTAGPAPTGPAPGAAPTESFLGTPARGFVKDFTYESRATSRGTHYAVPGEQPLVEHYRPIQPAASEPLPAPPAGSTLGDVWFTGLVSLADEPATDPVFSMPTVDSGALSPEPLIRSVNFPVGLGTVTPSGTLALFPGQYRSGDTPGQGTQLRFSRMEYQVFYPSSPDAARPTFTSVQGSDTGATPGTAFRVGVQGADHVGVLAKGAGAATWSSTLLTQTAPGVWTGGVPVDVEEYFVQAVHDGRVGTTRAKGTDYTPTPADPALSVTPIGDLVTPTVAPWSRQPVRLSASDEREASVDGAPFAPLPQTIATDGVHRVEHRAVGTTATSFRLVPVDQTQPAVTISYPAPGQTVTAGGSTTPRFSCTDATSGIASCAPVGSAELDPSPGTHTLTVRAVDQAGNERSLSVQYEGLTYTFEGFFSPVDNAPSVNVIQAGRTVPTKFRLREAGAVVTDPAVVTRITESALSSCPDGSSKTVQEVAPQQAAGGLVYDPAAERFQYNWKTAKGARGCAKLTFTFADDTARYALFRFK